MTEIKKLVAFYQRNSKRNNLENQAIVLEGYRESRKIPWSEVRTYSDIGSGKSASRAGLELLLKDVQEGLISEVVVRDLSRLFRDWEQFGKLLKVFDKYGVKLTSIRENIDTSSAMGRALMMLVSVLAQLEREVLIERTMDGLERAKRNGKILGRPLGRKDSKRRKKAGYYRRYQNKQTSVLDQM